jgi:hypothetical protein
LPKIIKGKFFCAHNPGDFTVDDVLDVCSINRSNIKTKE